MMTVDEAVLAVGASVHGIFVSNHGARVLDSAPGAAEVIENITKEAKGKVTILAEGGVRSAEAMF